MFYNSVKVLEDNWNETTYSSDKKRRYFKHAELEFIRVECIKRSRSVWEFILPGWSMQGVSRREGVERFNKKYVGEFFNSIIISDDAKNIVFDYLFEGKW